MSLLRSMAVGLVLLVLGISSAQAVLITETWQSTITNAGITSFEVGDTFNWTVSYNDDDSLRMHTYSDGTNGIAEQGGGDDTLIGTLCTGTEAFKTGCTANYTFWTMFDEGIYDFSSYYAVMQADGYTGLDYYSTNETYRYAGTTTQLGTFRGDDFYFHFDSGGTGLATTYYVDAATGKKVSASTNYSSVLVSSQPTSVPEPASLALMGLGLVGLGFARRKKAA